MAGDTTTGGTGTGGSTGIGTGADTGSGTADGPAAPTTPTDPWVQFFKDLPASESKPLSGKTTVADGAGYPGELLARSLLDDTLSSVTTAVQRARARHVLVVEDRALLDSDGAHLAVATAMGRLREALERARAMVATLPPAGEVETAGGDGGDAGPVAGAEGAPPLEGITAALAPAVLGAAVSAIPKIIGGVADVVGMFRTNYTMTSRTVSADGTPVVAQVVRSLRAQLPTTGLSVDALETADLEGSELLSRLTSLRSLRHDLVADSAPARVRVAGADAAVATLTADRTATHAKLLKALEGDTKSDRLEARVAELDARVAEKRASVGADVAALATADAAVAAFDAFEAAVVTSPVGGRSPLTSALARESLHRPGGPSHVLFVSLDSIGADIATPESQLGKADAVSYFGGLQTSFLLYDVAARRTVDGGVERRLAQARLDLGSSRLTLTGTTELR